MAKTGQRRDEKRTLIDIKALSGKTDKKAKYLIFKGHHKGGDFFFALKAWELKWACLDILGLTSESDKKKESNKLARQVWREHK